MRCDFQCSSLDRLRQKTNSDWLFLLYKYGKSKSIKVITNHFLCGLRKIFFIYSPKKVVGLGSSGSSWNRFSSARGSMAKFRLIESWDSSTDWKTGLKGSIQISHQKTGLPAKRLDSCSKGGTNCILIPSGVALATLTWPDQQKLLLQTGYNHFISLYWKSQAKKHVVQRWFWLGFGSLLWPSITALLSQPVICDFPPREPRNP